MTKVKLYFRGDLHPTVETPYDQFLVALEGRSDFVQINIPDGKRMGFNKSHLIYWEVVQ